MIRMTLTKDLEKISGLRHYHRGRGGRMFRRLKVVLLLKPQLFLPILQILRFAVLYGTREVRQGIANIEKRKSCK